MRCLKRRIADALYRQLVAHARTTASQESTEIAAKAGTGREGTAGATYQTSAVDPSPYIDTSAAPSRTRKTDATARLRKRP